MWRGTDRQFKTDDKEQDDLRGLDEEFPNETTFESAEPLRVRLRGAMIRENLDRYKIRPSKRKNDLIIKTRWNFDNEAPVDRLHFLETDHELGWATDFFDDVVVVKRDTEPTRLHLRVQVYDIDGLNDEFVETVQKYANSAAVVNPQIAPYAQIIRLGTKALVDLVDNIDQHDEILDERITFEIEGPKTGHKLLQPGYFVCFREDTVRGNLELRHDLHVLENGETYDEGSYVVLEIDRPANVLDDAVARKQVIDQKAAKLVAELNGKGRSAESPLHFLRETLDAYSKYKRLERARAIQNTQNPTPAEQALLKTLRNDPDLEPYL